MSDQENSNHGIEREEVEDLFADGQDDAGMEEDELGGNVKTYEASDREGYGIEKDESDEDNINEETLKELEFSLPRHSAVHDYDDDAHMVRIPVFLTVETHPFDPGNFKEQVTKNAEQRHLNSLNDKQIQNELSTERLLNENTLRWRYTNSGDDEIVKQSNAHFVEWDDGSLSLKVGNEMFDLKQLPVDDLFLTRSHDNYEILQNDSIIAKLGNLVPSSTFTDTHRKLTQAVKGIQRKDKILTAVTEKDPLLKQRLADEDERKTLKMRRQLEHKRRTQEEKLESQAGYDPREFKRPSYENFENVYNNDDYDEEDNFVADDDNEEEEASEEEDELDKAAERLRKLKREGAEKYSLQAGEDEGTSEREEEDDDDDYDKDEEEKDKNIEAEDQDEQTKTSESDEKQTRKRKRIIESDEE